MVDAGIAKVQKEFTTENLRNTSTPNCGFIPIKHEDVKQGDLFLNSSHVIMFIGNNEEAKQGTFKTIECRGFGGKTHARYVQNVENNENDIVINQYKREELNKYVAFKILND